MSIKSKSNWKLGHVRSETGSLGHILEQDCVYSRLHSLINVQLCQNVILYRIYVKFKTGEVQFKNKSLSQLSEKHCVHSREHSFYSMFKKLC